MSILFFTAKWCSACKKMYPVIKHLEEKGFKVNFVDVDKDKKLTQQYKITLLPTTIILKDKKALKKYVGVVSEETILEVLKSQENYKIF